MTKEELKAIKSRVDGGYIHGRTKDDDLQFLLAFAEHVVNTLEIGISKPCGVQAPDISEEIVEDVDSAFNNLINGDVVRVQEFYAGPIRKYTLLPVDAEGTPCPQCDGKRCGDFLGEDCGAADEAPVRVS